MTMKRYRVTRDGDLDLAFTGRKVGEGESGDPGDFRHQWNRGTDVTLFLTESGRIVTAASHWSQWQGESGHDTAAVHDSGGEALAWLIEHDGGELGPASKAAWLEAAKAAPEVFRAEEEVE